MLFVFVALATGPAAAQDAAAGAKADVDSLVAYLVTLKKK